MPESVLSNTKPRKHKDKGTKLPAKKNYKLPHLFSRLHLQNGT